jgi:hypothetical protein
LIELLQTGRHVHFHCLITDGVFAPADGEAAFYQAAALSDATFARV